MAKLVKCNSYIAFVVHGSRASPRTAYALTVHPELVEGFFERRCEFNCYSPLVRKPASRRNFFKTNIYKEEEQ